MLLLTILSSFYTRVDFGRREKKSHRNSATFCSCTSDTQEENISPFSVHMKITFLCPFFANATHSLTNLYLPWKRAQGDDKKKKKKKKLQQRGSAMGVSQPVFTPTPRREDSSALWRAAPVASKQPRCQRRKSQTNPLTPNWPSGCFYTP